MKFNFLTKTAKQLLILTGVVSMGALSISPALADNQEGMKEGMKESSMEMETMPMNEGMESSTEMETMPMNESMESSTEMETMPMNEGMESSNEMETMPMNESMESSTEMETMPMNESMESSTEMEEAPMNEASTETGNIVEVASGNQSFSTLVKAIEAAGLADTLSDPNSSYTVFAPTDEAFNQLPEGTLEYLLKPENKEVLQRVLSYHVLPEAVASNEISGGNVDALNGGLATAVTDMGVVINNASVVTPDIQASNGIIHGINRVLLPSDLQSTLAAELGINEQNIYQ